MSPVPTSLINTEIQNPTSASDATTTTNQDLISKKKSKARTALLLARKRRRAGVSNGSGGIVEDEVESEGEEHGANGHVGGSDTDTEEEEEEHESSGSSDSEEDDEEEDQDQDQDQDEGVADATPSRQNASGEENGVERIHVHLPPHPSSPTPPSSQSVVDGPGPQSEPHSTAEPTVHDDRSFRPTADRPGETSTSIPDGQADGHAEGGALSPEEAKERALQEKKKRMREKNKAKRKAKQAERAVAAAAAAAEANVDPINRSERPSKPDDVSLEEEDGGVREGERGVVGGGAKGKARVKDRLKERQQRAERANRDRRFDNLLAEEEDKKRLDWAAEEGDGDVADEVDFEDFVEENMARGLSTTSSSSHAAVTSKKQPQVFPRSEWKQPSSSSAAAAGANNVSTPFDPRSSRFGLGPDPSSSRSQSYSRPSSVGGVEVGGVPGFPGGRGPPREGDRSLASLRLAYSERLANDPSFVPKIGSFYGHDERNLDDDLRGLASTSGRRGGRRGRTFERERERENGGVDAEGWEVVKGRKKEADLKAAARGDGRDGEPSMSVSVSAMRNPAWDRPSRSQPVMARDEDAGAGAGAGGGGGVVERKNDWSRPWTHDGYEELVKNEEAEQEREGRWRSGGKGKKAVGGTFGFRGSDQQQPAEGYARIRQVAAAPSDSRPPEPPWTKRSPVPFLYNEPGSRTYVEAETNKPMMQLRISLSPVEGLADLAVNDVQARGRLRMKAGVARVEFELKVGAPAVGEGGNDAIRGGGWANDRIIVIKFPGTVGNGLSVYPPAYEEKLRKERELQGQAGGTGGVATARSGILYAADPGKLEDGVAKEAERRESEAAGVNAAAFAAAAASLAAATAGHPHADSGLTSPDPTAQQHHAPHLLMPTPQSNVHQEPFCGGYMVPTPAPPPGLIPHYMMPPPDAPGYGYDPMTGHPLLYGPPNPYHNMPQPMQYYPYPPPTPNHAIPTPPPSSATPLPPPSSSATPPPFFAPPRQSARIQIKAPEPGQQRKKSSSLSKPRKTSSGSHDLDKEDPKSYLRSSHLHKASIYAQPFVPAGQHAGGSHTPMSEESSYLPIGAEPNYGSVEQNGIVYFFPGYETNAFPPPPTYAPPPPHHHVLTPASSSAQLTDPAILSIGGSSTIDGNARGEFEGNGGAGSPAPNYYGHYYYGPGPQSPNAHEFGVPYGGGGYDQGYHGGQGYYEDGGFGYGGGVPYEGQGDTEGVEAQ